MRSPRTYYELRDSQVSTPAPIVSFYWDIVKQHRPQLKTVLDLGAADARFSVGGHYEQYVGVEIDPDASAQAQPRPHVRIENACAFAFDETGFDACIGNPPYVRHHDIESPWKEETATRLSKELGFHFDMHGNLFLYFIALGLLKTNDDGLIAMVVPYEWVSRPSSKGLRELLTKNRWGVSVYRFQEAIFDGVMTTACITVIDKAVRTGEWGFFDVAGDLWLSNRNGVSGTPYDILPHSERGKIWARRAISPGSQKIFTLSEAQRIHHGLTLNDVVPCVTTLKHVPKVLRQLTTPAFRKHFIDSGKRCWLIKSNMPNLSKRLRTYLDSISEYERQTYTCINQEPWYNYEKSSTPNMLFHSGFTSFGPKVLINSVGAQTVGSVFGIFTEYKISQKQLQEHLLGIDFESQVVAQANSFKKIEVRQLNTVLIDWFKKIDKTM